MVKPSVVPTQIISSLVLSAVFFLVSHGSHAFPQTIVINEFLASNDSVNYDSFGNASDWLELYNFGTDTIDLAGMGLTDDSEDAFKWVCPSIRLAPGEYLIVWASDEDVTTLELHTNFKISAGGEFLGLFAANGTVIDTLTFGEQSTDVAFGRYPDGVDNWQFLPDPTPGAANKSGGQVENYEVNFSHPSNLYDAGFQLEISTIPEGGDVYFTTDGSEPNQYAKKYTGLLDLNWISVIRARVYSDNEARSELETRTYIIRDDPKLPVFSLVTDPDNLWDPNTGIYENYEKEGDDWERPARVRLIEDGESKFSAPAGIRIHGNSSRATDKKNFRVYFRSEYGERDLDYTLFPQQETDEFKRFILYAPSGDQATGSENWNMLHDVLSHAVFHEMGGLVSGWKPVALYLNTEYWGIYWLREFVNDDYVGSYLGYDDVDMIRSRRRWTPDAREGDKEFWDETYNYFKNHSLSQESNYLRVKNDYLDIENFTDYQIVNIFSGNWDWPDNNWDLASDRVGDDRRWRSIMWDTGAAWRYQYDHPTLEWATRDEVRTDIKYNDDANQLWSTLFLRKLLENRDYRYYFINRFADLLNTTFRSSHVGDIKKSLADWIRPEIPREAERWNGGTVSTWEYNQRVIDNFISRRPNIQISHIKSQFDISHTIQVTLQETQGQGSVTLNSLIPQDLPWTGTYFARIPMTLKATPAPGYRFEGWTDSSVSADSIINIERTASFSIGAVFTRQQQQVFNVLVDSISTSAARLTWESKWPSAASIRLTDATASGITVEDSSISTNHAVWLRNLQDSTTYNFDLTLADAGYGTAVYTGVFTTKMDHVPPQIEAVLVDSLARDFAAISWLTDEPAWSEIQFGEDSTNLQFQHRDTLFVTKHQMALDELQPARTYFFRVSSADRRQNMSVSQLFSFRTSADTRKPAFVNFIIDSVSIDSAFVQWQTAQPTISWMEFGEDSSLSFTMHPDSLVKETHAVWLSGLEAATKYFLRIGAKRSMSGDTTYTEVASFQTLNPSGIAGEKTAGLPDVFQMSQNYPNPFNIETRVRIAVPEQGRLKGWIYDITGRIVRTFNERAVSPGFMELTWQGWDDSKRVVSSGLYILRVQFEGISGERNTESVRLVLLK